MPISKSNHFLNRSHPISLLPFTESTFWIVDLEGIQEEEIAEAKNFLDAESLNHIDRFIFSEDRHKNLIAHAVLRFHLGLRLKQKPDRIELLRSDHGKPYLKDHSLHFNLSHTKHYAFIGIHPSRPIGIDIEIVQDRPDLLNTAKTVMHPCECELIENASNPCHCFYDFWCAKEAMLKAQGTGFLVHQLPSLQEISTPIANARQFSSGDLSIFVYDERINKHKLSVCVLP